MEDGQNILITGIGGGSAFAELLNNLPLLTISLFLSFSMFSVAIQALQFAISAGAKVFVSSGQPEKIERAKKLGATDGVNYKEGKLLQIHHHYFTSNSAQMLPISYRRLAQEITSDVTQR